MLYQESDWALTIRFKKFMKYLFNLFLLIVVIFVSSCEKKVWDNPFDKAAPKSIFTPSNLFATQVGTSISLSWMETNNLISGYIIEKQIDNGSFLKIANLPKGSLKYLDNSAISGKLHTYRLTAFALDNFSNPIIASIRPASAPKIVQISLNSKTFSSASFTTTLTDEGSTITSKGVCYSTSPSPTISNSKTIDGVGSGTFVSNISNLNSNVIYFIKPYATNSVGTSYGLEQTIVLNLNVAGPNSTDGSGNVYNSVKIGDQIWISKNLIATKYQNGQSIPNITDSKSWTNLSSGAYCDFINDINIGKIYGHLYNYYSVSDSRNICPIGWHVPTKVEWETLINYLGGPVYAGNKLKESGSLYWLPPNAEGDNSSGFSARAGSWRSQDALFYYGVKTGGALFWTSTKDDPKYPWVMGIQTFGETVKIVKDPYFESAAGTSIRCLKN
jgi:uncharacterized protein (TIGR02145 family)